MAYYSLIAPKQQWLDANGNPYSGAKLFFYSAGTSTKKTTYTDDTGTVANSNPIVLNSAGQCANGVYGSSGAYKLVLAPSTDTDPPLSPYWTQDGVAGINDVAASVPDEWISLGLTPTFISGTSFSVPGDQTSILTVYRRLKISLSGGTRYATIVTSSFGASITTLTLAVDSGLSIDATISGVSYGIISATSTSAPLLGLVWLQRATGSNVGSIDIESVLNSNLYAGYVLDVEYLHPNTNATSILLRIRQSGAYATTNYVSQLGFVSSSAVGTYQGQANTDGIHLVATSSGSSTAANAWSGTIKIPNAHSVFNNISFSGQGNYTSSAATNINTFIQGVRTAQATVEGFRFVGAAGNITGAINVFGIRKQ